MPSSHAADTPAPRCRPASLPADQIGWLSLRELLWPDATRDAHRAEIQAMTATPDTASAFVAQTRGGELVGLAECTIRAWSDGSEQRPVVHLEGWIVAPSWRRRGIGRSLVEAVGRWGRAHGARAFTSDTEIDNAVGRAAHRAVGSEESARIVCFSRPLPGLT